MRNPGPLFSQDFLNKMEAHGSIKREQKKTTKFAIGFESDKKLKSESP
jgi:hypothetical protein